MHNFCYADFIIFVLIKHVRSFARIVKMSSSWNSVTDAHVGPLLKDFPVALCTSSSKNSGGESLISDTARFSCLKAFLLSPEA